MLCTYYGLYLALTPIQHATDERMETSVVFRSNVGVLPDGERVKIYNVSANAFRHGVREHAALRLLDLVGLTLSDIPEMTNVVLFSGGPRLDKKRGDVVAGGPGKIPIAYSNTICEWFPMLELLGTTTLFCFVPHFGSRLAPTALNALTRKVAAFPLEAKVLAAHGVDPAMLPATVTELQFNVKHDPRTHYDELDGKKADAGEVRNLFDVQYVVKGTRFANRVVIDDHDDGMLSSCFASAMAAWRQRAGFIAGKRAQGAGVISWTYTPELPPPGLYEDFVAERKDALRALLLDADIWKDEKALLRHLP